MTRKGNSETIQIAPARANDVDHWAACLAVMTAFPRVCGQLLPALAEIRHDNDRLRALGFKGSSQHRVV